MERTQADIELMETALDLDWTTPAKNGVLIVVNRSMSSGFNEKG